MTIAKFAATWILDKIRKELTIQKLKPGSQPYVSSRKPVNKGDAAKGFMLLIIAPVIFCALAILVL
jgi:hypothetical protein